jgi:glycosyltransferase involved in cell wall biosynthesis
MSHPEISVVVPTKNRERYILEAVNSVLAQTISNHEIVVIDDGSADRTRELLEPYISDGRVRYYFRDAAGVSAARNFGVEQARGRLIAFLDSDDLFLPSKLEKQFALLEGNAGLGFVHCSFSKFDNAGNDLGVRDTSTLQGSLYPEILQEWSILMAMPCMMIPKTIFEQVGGFDPSMNWAEDLDLWRRVGRKFPIGVVPEVLVKVRVHQDSTTFSKRNGARGFEMYLQKAFAEDPSLPDDFKASATAAMYAKLGQNLLGEGGAEDMQLVRLYSSKALAAKSFHGGALFSLMASYLPGPIRRILILGFRRWRYRSKAQTL